MMDSMKLLMKVLLFASLATAGSPELSTIKSVYMLPMQAGLDQYLAVRLTTGGILRVVTDPQLADAVFTDRIGAGFDETLRDLTTSPEEKAERAKNGDDSRVFLSPGIRGKGSVFLVGRKTHAVVWSMHSEYRDSQAETLNRLAVKIADQLRKDLKEK
jgi:hypothetical protein